MGVEFLFLGKYRDSEKNGYEGDNSNQPSKSEESKTSNSPSNDFLKNLLQILAPIFFGKKG